jgi:hypothetical protein
MSFKETHQETHHCTCANLRYHFKNLRSRMSSLFEDGHLATPLSLTWCISNNNRMSRPEVTWSRPSQSPRLAIEIGRNFTFCTVFAMLELINNTVSQRSLIYSMMRECGPIGIFSRPPTFSAYTFQV